MAAAIANVWHLRTVAETSAKSCFVCYRPSAKVLVTPDNKDFFYVCASHLSDTGFATPVVDAEAQAAKQKKAEMDLEVQKVIQEYEEKQKRKKAKAKSKDDKDKSSDKKTADEDEKESKEKDDKIKAIKAGGDTPNDEARVFTLHRTFYQLRIDRLRGIETAKRNQQRLRDPTFFPSTPKGELQ